MSNPTEEELYALKINERLDIDSTSWVRRVPRGFIYYSFTLPHGAITSNYVPAKVKELKKEVRTTSVIEKPFREAFKWFMDRNNLTQVDVAYDLGISKQAVSKFLGYDGKVQNAMQKKIYKAYPRFKKIYKK